MEGGDDGTNKSKRPTKYDEKKSNSSGNDPERKNPNSGSHGGKRLKKDDSGISALPESDNSDFSDSGANSGVESKILENLSCQSEPNTSDSCNIESSSKGLEAKATNKNKSSPSENEVSNDKEISADSADEVSSQATAMESTDDDDGNQNLRKIRSKLYKRANTNLSSSSDDEIDEEEQLKRKEEIDKKYDPTPKTPRPVHRWSATKAVLNRQFGVASHYSPDLFRFNCYGSLHMVERLELMYKMKKHDGCVNALNFNTSGTKLVTGSDDLDIIIWDWTTSEPILNYNSGHSSNVFQAKFMPLSGDCHIVTCARDGQVRVGELSSSGVCKGTRKLGHHRGAVHKLALHKDNPHVFLSCAEDGDVYLFDLRSEKRESSTHKLVTVKENDKRIPLYSICCNPMKPFEFIVGGRSQYVKIFDTRYSSDENEFVKKFYCPSHLVDRQVRANVTSCVYNYNGEEILASYNEDIYTFDCKEADSSKYSHRFRGHKNNQTIKGVNYFGSKSEYVVSGSDCGHIFFWDKESEHIVKYMYGDEMGVVNCIEPHPHMPVLATSGLDDDVKIWVPSCENEPDLSKLREHVINNMKEQDIESLNVECSDAFVDQTILFLMQHLSRARTRQRPVLWNEGGNDNGSNSSTSDSDIQDDDSDGRPALQCSQS